MNWMGMTTLLVVVVWQWTTQGKMIMWIIVEQLGYYHTMLWGYISNSITYWWNRKKKHFLLYPFILCFHLDMLCMCRWCIMYFWVVDGKHENIVLLFHAEWLKHVLLHVQGQWLCQGLNLCSIRWWCEMWLVGNLCCWRAITRLARIVNTHCRDTRNNLVSNQAVKSGLRPVKL